MQRVSGSVDPTQLGLSPALSAAGVNLAGVLPIRSYDERVPSGWRSVALLPSARSAVMLATGGPAFFQAFRQSPEAGGSLDPLDRFLVRVVEAAIRAEPAAVAGYYFERRDGFADFVGLARASGLGVPSRLGILIHPEYGPWFAIRALILTERDLAPTHGDPGFDPCNGCPAPCASACPGNALHAPSFDLLRCTAHSRIDPACRVGCAARRACPVGAQHRYEPDGEAHHRVAALARLPVD